MISYLQRYSEEKCLVFCVTCSVQYKCIAACLVRDETTNDDVVLKSLVYYSLETAAVTAAAAAELTLCTSNDGTKIQKYIILN